MKEIEPPFRLYDFLAYLFPGAATLHAYYVLRTAKFETVLQGVATSSEMLNVVILLIVSYAIGLLWSVMGRDILRKYFWRTYSNPRLEGFNGTTSPQSPFSNSFAVAVRAKAEKLFGAQLNVEQAHLLCRAYVAHHCPTSWQQRQSIVAVRGMCLNFIGPTLLYAGVFFSKGWCWLGLACLFGAVILSKKTISLDEREWREIYCAFLLERENADKSDSHS